MKAQLFDPRICALGEGPLWHPLRNQLFWFDILSKRLLTQEAGKPKHWQFDEHVSAASWIDAETLLIASQTQLFCFDLNTGAQIHIAALEPDNKITRSNDGRADPWGGFWIGTMGMNSESGAGAIYRFFRGKVHQLYASITIPNGISFSPDKRFAYFADTSTRKIMRQTLDAEGWPNGDANLFVDLNVEGLNPDGSVVDSEGCLWNAQWGAARVARYAPDGIFLSAIDFPTGQISCPAFGGADLSTLFATSAAVGMKDSRAGHTFSNPTGFKGQLEHQVIL